MLHNVYISRCETCFSATQETAGSGLNKLYNVLCWLWNIHLGALLPRLYSITNTKHWITYTCWHMTRELLLLWSFNVRIGGYDTRLVSNTLLPYSKFWVPLSKSKQYYRKKERKKGKNQVSKQWSTTPNSRYHTGKLQNHKKSAKTRKPRCPPFPSKRSQSCKVQTRQYDKKKHKTKTSKSIH